MVKVIAVAMMAATRAAMATMRIAQRIMVPTAAMEVMTAVMEAMEVLMDMDTRMPIAMTLTFDRWCWKWLVQDWICINFRYGWAQSWRNVLLTFTATREYWPLIRIRRH